MLLLEGKVPRSFIEAFLGSYVGLPEALKKRVRFNTRRGFQGFAFDGRHLSQ